MTARKETSMNRVWLMWSAVSLSMIALIGVIFALVFGASLRSAPGLCRDKTRVVSSEEHGEWLVCDHENHQLLERPIGYGRVLVTCACADKDASVPLTEEESRAMDEMADAGGKLPTADDLYRSLPDAGR
jgi:hypothetical protein